MTEASPLAAQPFDPSDAPAAARFAAPLCGTGPTHLLLVTGAAEPSDWPVRASIAIADAVAAADDHAVVLADLSFEAPVLDARLGVEADEGLSDVLLFGASPEHVRVPVPGHRFELIAAGLGIFKSADLLHHPRWQAVIESLDRERTRLLACVPASAKGIGGLLRRAGVVFIGSAAAADQWRARWPAADLRLVLRPQERPAVPASGASAVARGVATQRHWRRTIGVALVVVLIASAIGGLWHFGRDDAAGSAPTAADGAPAPSPGEPSPAATPLAAVQPAGVPLPYSVAVEAHDNLPMAARRVASLDAAQPGTGFYIAPILVDSTLYYRVMAGPLADSAAAVAVMQALIEGGHKTGGSEWDIRSTPYAFLIGEYEGAEQATARMEELRALDIPSYVAEVPYADGPPKFYLYSGAYSSPAEADLMRRLLRSAGLPDTLVQRIGRSPT